MLFTEYYYGDQIWWYGRDMLTHKDRWDMGDEGKHGSIIIQCNFNRRWKWWQFKWLDSIVNTVMSSRVPQKACNFLTSFLRTAQIHGVKPYLLNKRSFCFMFVFGLGLMRTNENFEPLHITTGFKTSGVWYVTINRPVFVIRITKIAIFQPAHTHS